MNVLRNVSAVLDPSGMITVTGRLTYPRTATGLDGFTISARGFMFGGPVHVFTGDGYPRPVVVVVHDRTRYGSFECTRDARNWLYSYLGLWDTIATTSNEGG